MIPFFINQGIKVLVQRTIYLLPERQRTADFLKELKNIFPVLTEKPLRSQLSFYDTFDWQLYRNGRYLVRRKNLYNLYAYPDDDLLASQSWGRKEAPRFWWDFPDGTFRKELKRDLDLRALMSIGSLIRTKQRVRILNDDHKTVVITELEEIIRDSNTSIKRFRIIPVRGYREEFSEVITYIHSLDYSEESEQSPFRYLDLGSRKPGDYSSRVRVALSPAMTGLEATTVIFNALIDVAEQNLEGMKEDIDTEFVHDFRVSIRRIRSALSQIKGIFDTETKGRFKEDFDTLGKTTNKLRDLDVYLLRRQEYYNLVPESLQQGLDVLFTKLAGQRTREHKKLVEHIDSGMIQTTLNALRTFLNGDEAKKHKGPNGGKNVLNLARGFLYKEFRNVANKGSKIGPKTPDEKLHKLRIECKRLRYLMEFFASLFKEEEINYLIRQLKKLQDNLGEFNDLSVQQETMQGYLNEVNWSNKNAPVITAALGGLISSLYLRQKEVRDAFQSAFSEFSSEENRQRFEKLFNPVQA